MIGWGGMTQVVEGLPNKLKAFISNPRTRGEKCIMVIKLFSLENRLGLQKVSK
jgi:hypothetical protein